MDDQTRVFLRGAYQYLEGHERATTEIMIVTAALRKTIFELGPQVAETYLKHYRAESQGPLKIAGDATTRALAESILQLNDS